MEIGKGGEVVWGLTRGLRGESRAFWGINTQDKSHYRTTQGELHAKWPHGGCVMVCLCMFNSTSCICALAERVQSSLHGGTRESLGGGQVPA